MGAAGVGGLIAHISFWCLVVWGWATGELGVSVAVVLILWLAGFFGQSLLPQGNWLFTSFVSMLDVSLVLLIFKGDVRIT